MVGTPKGLVKPLYSLRVWLTMDTQCIYEFVVATFIPNHCNQKIIGEPFFHISFEGGLNSPWWVTLWVECVGALNYCYPGGHNVGDVCFNDFSSRTGRRLWHTWPSILTRAWIGKKGITFMIRWNNLQVSDIKVACNHNLSFPSSSSDFALPKSTLDAPQIIKYFWSKTCVFTVRGMRSLIETN